MSNRLLSRIVLAPWQRVKLHVGKRSTVDPGATVPGKPSSARRLPPPPSGFDRERFFDGVCWFQRWAVFEGVETPGMVDLDGMCQHLALPDDFTGKRVLDIGAWNGCLSFECERRGAREVIALGPEDPVQTGFERLRGVLQSTRVRYLKGTAYDLNPERLGTFDVVLFCGVLYHLRYPLLAIDNLRRVCTGEVFVETFVVDNNFIMEARDGPEPVPLKSVSPRLASIPLWQFYRTGELAHDCSNWFGPNITGVVQAFRSAGFDIRLVDTWRDRASFYGRVNDGLPEFLAVSPADRTFYDVLLRPVLGDQPLLRAGTSAGGVIDGPESRRQLVVHAYQTYLHRTPGRDELAFWVNVLQQGSTADDLAVAFVSSDEYFRRCASSNSQWLDQMFIDLLGEGHHCDLKATLAALESGTTTRGQVACNLIRSRA